MGDHTRFGVDYRGVSPVGGVVLMIAITVVGSAAGMLVLQITHDQLGEMSEDGVDADFPVAFNGDTVEVTHAGGDAVSADKLTIDGDVHRSQRWGRVWRGRAWRFGDCRCLRVESYDRRCSLWNIRRRGALLRAEG